MMNLRIVFLIISLLFTFALVKAQDSQISFSETTVDFGTIGNQDGKFTHDFILTNNSETALVISKVVPTCGCTASDWTQEPIEPGKSGKISVVYNPAGNVGPVTKTIRVTTNLKPTNTTLFIKAIVEEGKSDPSINYPWGIGNLLFRKALELDFGQVDSNIHKKLDIEVYNNSFNDISNLFSLPIFISVEPQLIPAKKKTVLTCTLDPQKYGQIGLLDGFIIFKEEKQNKGNETKRIPYRAFIKEHFEELSLEEMENRGKINLNLQKLNFSKSDKNNSVILKIANSGNSVLNIKGIQTHNPGIKFSKTALKIKPGEIAEVKVDYPVHKLKEEVSSSVIYLISDDPRNSVMEINVNVNP